MKTSRAALIAKQLNNTELWCSHGYGISMEILRRDLKLEIEDFGANPALNEKLKAYYMLLVDYMRRLGHKDIIHIKGKYLPLII